MTDVDRCRREMAECRAYLNHGGPDEAGALLGYCDWKGELELLLKMEEPAND